MSHWKETLRARDRINLIGVLTAGRETPRAQVLPEAIALRDRVMAQYLRLRDHALRSASPAARRYIAGLDAWIRGNLDWGMSSDRYRNPGNPADLPATPVSGTPTCTDTSPIAGVTQWWDLTPRPPTAEM
jgi:hypothetical protein